MTSASETIESSAVRKEELDRLLRLMCDVFDMDFDAAHPIFYSDPYFESEKKRVLRVGGEIVSCLTVVERECWLGRSVLKVAGVAGVATQPEQQRRGYAGRLLTETLLAYRQQGFHLSALFPFAPDYYRKFGWEVSGEIPKAHISPFTLSQSPETQYIRPAQQADLPTIAGLYEHAASGQAFHCLRDEKRWQYLFTYVRNKVVFAPDGKNVEGYLFYDYQPVPDPAGTNPSAGPLPPCLRVLEIAAQSERAKCGLIGHLARQTHAGSIEYAAPYSQIAEFGFSPRTASVRNRVEEGERRDIAFMARILNWPALVQAMLPNWNHFLGEIGLILHDPLLTESPEGMVVSGDGKEAAARRVKAEQIVSSSVHSIVGDVRGWTPVAVGHVKVEQACLRGTLQPSSDEAVRLASQLFPERAPFLPLADHF